MARGDTPLADPIVAPLQIYVLGPPRIQWAGQLLPVPRRQARALLFNLACSQLAIPRQALDFLFWADIPESVARRRFTRLLSHLRCALPLPEVLQTADDHVGLDMHRTWSDLVEFDRLCAEQHSSSRFASLQRAVALYRGPFLAGFSLPESPEFEAWILQQQGVQERLYLEALDSLIEQCAARGAYQEAIAYAQRYLDTDDLAESVHRRLIELYAVAGDRTAALRQFEHCVTVMERELGVSPLPETRLAYEAVLRGSHPEQASPMVQSPTWTTLPSLHAPLVGRDEPLRHLQKAFGQARLGHGSVTLLAGEPGIGKSRLMQEFVNGLRDQSVVVIGSSHEAERGLPYWPLVEALRPHALSANLAALQVDPLYLAEVARLLPELRSSLPALPALPPAELSQDQGRLFHALTQWLLAMARGNPPLVLCLDNLHWADATTLSWLGYLARRIQMAPVLVLGTYRTEQASAVASLRTSLLRLGLLSEIVLEGLAVPEIVQLIQHLSGRTEGSMRRIQRLHRDTGGNPFFLLEILRAMFEAGILWNDGTGWATSWDETAEGYEGLPLPDTVCHAIQERVSHLSLHARQVLEAGAVLGRRFDLTVVRQTSGRSEAEVVDALEMLSDRHLVSEDAGSYEFGHDLIRTIVYRDLSYGRRRLLHLRAATTLLRLRSNDIGALARHFEAAGEPGRAARYLLRAGEQARDVYAHIEARASFDKALALLEKEAARLQDPKAIVANRRLQVQALAVRGWVFRLLGDMEAYARDSQEVAKLAGILGDRRTLAHLRWREAYTHRWFCHYAEARCAAEEGVQLSQAAGDALAEALCLREVGMADRAAGDYARAQDALERALGLFASLDEPGYEIHTLGNLSTLCWYLGDHYQALDLGWQAMARCDEADLPFERRLPLGDMGVAAAAMGEVDQARAWLEESLSIARRIADRTQEIFCLGHLGWLELGAERPDEAVERIGAALALAERVDSCTEQAWLHAGLAEAHRLAGDPLQAANHGRQALKLAQEHGLVYEQDLARRVRAKLP